MNYFLKFRTVSKHVSIVLSALSLLATASPTKAFDNGNSPITTGKATSGSHHSSMLAIIAEPPFIHSQIISMLEDAEDLYETGTDDSLQAALEKLSQAMDDARFIGKLGYVGVYAETRLQADEIHSKVRTALTNANAPLDAQSAFLDSVEWLGSDNRLVIKAHKDLADTYFRLGRNREALTHCTRAKSCQRRAGYAN